MIKAKSLILGLFSAICITGNVYSLDNNNPSIFLNNNAKAEYQLAKSTFLPDSFDDLGLSGHENTKYDHNQGDNCAGYELTSCPANGNCSSCSFNRKLKRLVSCASGYTKKGNTCSAGSCAAVGYESSIPANKICTKYTEGSLTCYKDCRAVSCSGYTQNCDSFNVANSAGKATCPDCESGNANCSPKLCKVSSCMDGYKIADNGSSCIPLDDTCPTNYFKECETGTQGEPEYTEKGTACYQCKPKITDMVKVIVGFDSQCPSGLSFSMSAPGKNMTPYSGSQYYVPANFSYGSYTNPTQTSVPAPKYTGNESSTGSLVNASGNVTLNNIPENVGFIQNLSTNYSYAIPVQSSSLTFNSSPLIYPQMTYNSDLDYWIFYCGEKLPILYSDLTTSTELVSDKTPIGIVFDESKKLAVALTEAEKAWSTTHFDIPELPNLTGTQALSDWSGKTNTKTIVDYCQANAQSCPAAEFAYNYSTEGTKPGDWYLPAAAEAKAIYFKRVSLDRMLSLVNGTLIQYSKTILSSSEMDKATPWACCTTNGGDSPNPGTMDIWGTNKVVNHIITRPVINYGNLQKPLPILYSDLTTSTEVIAGKTPIGIVFDEDKKLALALNSGGNMAWSAELFDIPILTNYETKELAQEDWAGRDNTTAIITYCSANSKSCPAAEYANSYSTEGTSPGDWYLPALGELESIYSQQPAIDLSLAKVNGTAIETWYWSSTEHYTTNTWHRRLNGITDSAPKSWNKLVRAVIDYSNVLTGMDLMCAQLSLNPEARFCGGIDPYAGNKGNYPYCLDNGSFTGYAGTLNNGHTCWSCPSGQKLHCYTNSPSVSGCDTYENGKCVLCYNGTLVDGKCI